MIFTPDEQQQMICDMVHDFAKTELAPKAAWRDETGTFPVEEYRKMGELGLLGMNVPAELGGSEVGVVAYSLAIMEVGKVDMSVAVGMSVTNMVAETISLFACDEVKKKYVPYLTSGDAIAGSFALTEANSGSDAASMRSTAVLDNDEWVINGTKMFITSADHAGVFVVWAKTDKHIKATGRVSAFLIPADTPGILLGKKERKMGQIGSSTVEVSFDDCRIPKNHLLGEVGRGFQIAMVVLNGGRIGIGSASVGIGMAALELARDYALERFQFGKAIAEFQAIQWKIADMATEIEAARLLVMRAAWLKENGNPYSKEASMAKLYATESANRACYESLQIHGGYGYIKDYTIERLYRDARATTLYEGTSEIQHIVIAREILAD